MTNNKISKIIRITAVSILLACAIFFIITAIDLFGSKKSESLAYHDTYYVIGITSSLIFGFFVFGALLLLVFNRQLARLLSNQDS